MKNPVNWAGAGLFAFLMYWNLLEIPWRGTKSHTIIGNYPIGTTPTPRPGSYPWYEVAWSTLSVTLLHAFAVWLMIFACMKLIEAAVRAIRRRHP